MTIKYFRHPNLTIEDDIWCDELAGRYFDPKEDKGLATEEESSFEISKRFPYAWTVVKDNDKRIGYTYILPATKELMDKFASGKINEEKAMQHINDKLTYKNCDAAYLAGAVFIEEYKNKGHAIRATIDTLNHMDEERGFKIKDLYVWAYTIDTNKWIEKAKVFAEKNGRTLHVYRSEE
jgi:hypothetical protein